MFEGLFPAASWPLTWVSVHNLETQKCLRKTGMQVRWWLGPVPAGMRTLRMQDWYAHCVYLYGKQLVVSAVPTIVLIHFPSAPLEQSPLWACLRDNCPSTFYQVHSSQSNGSMSALLFSHGNICPPWAQPCCEERDHRLLLCSLLPRERSPGKMSEQLALINSPSVIPNTNYYCELLIASFLATF